MKLIFLSLLPFCLLFSNISSAQISRFQQGSRSAVQHPKAEFYPYTSTETISLDLADRTLKTTDVTIQHLINRLIATEISDSIGVLEEKIEEVFGRITALETDSSGHVYILDSEFSEVRVFDEDFSYLTTIGSAGQGPGEFISPSHLTFNDNEELFVLDRRARLSHFGNFQQKFVLNETVSLQDHNFKGDLLIMNDKIYLRGTKARSKTLVNTIKVLSSISNSRGSYFGKGYAYGGELPQNLLSGNGPIERVGQNIISAGGFLPFIESFTPSGQLNWVIQVDNFGQHTIETDGIYTVAKNPTGNDMRISVLKAIDQRYAIIQIYAFGPESYQTWLIDAETGEGYFVSDKLPKIYEITENGFYAKASTDYPRVDYYEFQD